MPAAGKRCRALRPPAYENRQGGNRGREGVVSAVEGRPAVPSRCPDFSVCPKPDIRRTHSITSSARRRIDGGKVRPSDFAVLALTTSSNLVGCSTGTSAGLAPLRTLATIIAVCRHISARLGPYDMRPP